MRSLSTYSNKTFTYYNSIQAKAESIPVNNYYDLIKEHGSSIDSVFGKMNEYIYRQKNPNYVNESYQDIYFDIDEQFAVRDILTSICNQYIESLYRDFCNENEIQITEGFSSVKDMMSKIGSVVKSGSEKVVDGFKKLGEKIQQVKAFLKDVMNNAIKSAKELVNKITEMMISIGTSLAELVKKLGGNDEEAFSEYQQMVEEGFKSEKTAKENVYESIQNMLIGDTAINEEYITEFLGFGKKKDKTPEKENEYDKAAKAKKGGKIANGLKMVGNAGLKILLQMMAYYAVTIVLPAVVTLIAGPLAGAIVETVAKLCWSGRVVYKQVKDMIKTYKSDEYKNSPKWLKVVRWVMFLVSLGFAVNTLGKAVGDAWGIGKKIWEGLADEVLPSDVVTKVTEILNGFYKSITGSNAGGYDKLVETQNKVLTKVVEVAGDGKEASDAAKEKFDTHRNTEFDKNETNNFKHYDDMGQEDLSNKLQDISKAGETSSQGVLNNVTATTVPTPGTTAFAVDGATLGKIGREQFIKEIASKMKVDPSDIDISQVSDIALRDSTNGVAGTFFVVLVKGDATQEFANQAQQAVQSVASGAGISGGGFFHMFSEIANNISPIKKLIELPVNLFKNSFSAFAGIGPIALNYGKKGGFILRLGSGRTGNHKYKIEPMNSKSMTFNELANKYKDKNPSVFEEQQKVVNDNYEALNKAIKELEDKKGSLSKEEKKRLKLMKKQQNKMGEGASEYEVLVFYTKDEFANKTVTGKKSPKIGEAKEEENVENTEKKESNELYPVCFFNPLIMAGGDIAPRSSSKPPRQHMYFAKGILSRWEILSLDGGMGTDDVLEMLTSIMKESLKACYDMAIDLPFTKEGKQYVENDKSMYKGKERMDFGGFTNTELTKIFNDPDSVSDYLSGKYANDNLIGWGKHKYTERTDTDELKQHHEDAVKEYEDIIQNNDKVKEIVDKSDSLKKFLYDDEGKLKDGAVEKLSDTLIRTENSYLNKGKKKSFFSKLKSWFKGEKEESEVSDIDSEDLKQFVLKVASARVKRHKELQTKESYNEDDDNDIFEESPILFETNMMVLERDWDKCFKEIFLS